MAKPDQEQFNYAFHRRPWVSLNGGTPFIGPKLFDLLVAYYVTQGEREPRAIEFAKAQMSAFYADL